MNFLNFVNTHMYIDIVLGSDIDDDLYRVAEDRTETPPISHRDHVWCLMYINMPV